MGDKNSFAMSSFDESQDLDASQQSARRRNQRSQRMKATAGEAVCDESDDRVVLGSQFEDTRNVEHALNIMQHGPSYFAGQAVDEGHEGRDEEDDGISTPKVPE